MYIQRFISGTTYSTYISQNKMDVKVKETDHEKLNGHNIRESSGIILYYVQRKLDHRSPIPDSKFKIWSL